MGGLSWEEETLPASHPLGEGDPSVPLGASESRGQTDSTKWGAGWSWMPGADSAPGRTRWEGCGGSSGAGARGLLTFPGKASELHNQSCWLLGSD